MQKSVEEIIEAVNGSRKTLYVLCGLPYSGKTFLARQIVEGTACVHVSIDSILERSGYDWDSNRLPDENGWKEIMNLSYRESQKSLRDSLNVLYDSTNHTRASRGMLRRVADEVSAKTQIIYLDVPVDVVRKRWEENKADKKRFILDKELLDMTIQSLEVPGGDESPWLLKN